MYLTRKSQSSKTIDIFNEIQTNENIPFQFHQITL